MNDLGKRLRDARNARGLTQKDLARKSGVSQATISDIERGRNESSKELPALAKALGASVDDLVGGRPKQQTDDFLRVSVWDTPDDLDPDQHVVIPRVQVKFSAGNGHYAFPASMPEVLAVGFQALDAAFLFQQLLLVGDLGLEFPAAFPQWNEPL